MFFVAFPLMLLIFSLCWFGYHVSRHVPPWVYLVQDSLYFLGLSECLLSYVRLVLHDLINAALSLIIIPRRFPSPLSQLKLSLQPLMPTGRLFWCWDDNSNYSICSLFPPTPLSKPETWESPSPHPPSTYSVWHHSPPSFTLWGQWILLPKSLSLFSHPRSGHHLFWVISAASPDGPARWPHLILQQEHQVLPICVPLLTLLFLPLPLANSYPSFRFPISSSQKTTKPDLGPPCYVFPIKALITWYGQFLFNVCVTLLDMSVWFIILAPEARTVTVDVHKLLDE